VTTDTAITAALDNFMVDGGYVDEGGRHGGRDLKPREAAAIRWLISTDHTFPFLISLAGQAIAWFAAPRERKFPSPLSWRQWEALVSCYRSRSRHQAPAPAPVVAAASPVAASPVVAAPSPVAAAASPVAAAASPVAAAASPVAAAASPVAAAASSVAASPDCPFCRKGVLRRNGASRWKECDRCQYCDRCGSHCYGDCQANPSCFDRSSRRI
jgi:hypothetical protein